MDDYWNYIATPLFFVVLLFGIFVLFRVSKTQLITAPPIADMINSLRKSSNVPTAAKAANAPAAAPAAAATK
jgi:hypothetical protein